MSVPFGRNVVIPASLIACAIAASFAPGVNVRFSLFLLIMSLAVSTTVWALWPEPPVAVALGAPSLDAVGQGPTAGR
jgi:hypothetical protein